VALDDLPHVDDGALYRRGVIGSGGHAVATRRLLAAVARAAEDPARVAR
jgi:hypothetical protein